MDSKNLAASSYFDVLLGSVDDPDDAELDGYDPAAEDVDGVRAGVHQVQLGHDGQRASTVGVNLARNLQTFGGSHVHVGGTRRKKEKFFNQRRALALIASTGS